MQNSQTNDCSYTCEIETGVPETAKSLVTLHIGEKKIIVKITGGRNACKRLNELGLIPGTEIEMVNKINDGPVMIKVKGSKLALGRGLATKVIVAD
ncbi:MAG: ferrous iron transport protein A [Asgard group archaeon]|nr:ferrous iron transport protein A [Asgard group archaeon]